MDAAQAARGGGRWEISPEAARRATDPARLGFASTDELPPPGEMVGQARAREAIAFALQTADERYNLYVSGSPGSGRLTTALRAVRAVAARAAAPRDWCYVHDFARPGEPIAIGLPAGDGRAFARDVDAFVATCRRELRRALGSDAYRARRAEVLEDLDARHTHLLEGLRQEALGRGFVLQGTPMGLAITPLRAAVRDTPSSGPQAWLHRPAAAPSAGPAQGEADLLAPQEFAALPPEERERLGRERDQVQEALARILPELHALEDEAHERIRALERGTAQQAVDRPVAQLLGRYPGDAKISDFVRHLAPDVVEHAQLLLSGSADAAGRPERERASDAADGAGETPDANGPDGLLLSLPGMVADEDLSERLAVAALLRRYRVNVLVTREGAHAPVVQELNPTALALLGRIEFGLREGLPYTDHLLIKAGALHRANGGYLVLQARDLLRHPGAWDALKRVLRFGVIGLEDGDGAPGLLTSASLRPEPIPARLKVVLIGEPEIYDALLQLDPEFAELFKVRAEFDAVMPRTAEAERFYAAFAGDVARTHGRPPLDAAAVAGLIEEGSRWAGDQDKLSTGLRAIHDLAVEACDLAVGEGAATVSGEHVARAVAARERRASLVPDKLDEAIARGTILIDTAGAVVGQVNGLTVLEEGGYAFGKPARITARTAPGLAGIVNLERETQMSGPAHTKGILILGGYLAGRYAGDDALSLSGSICFEQVYGQVEGDSASSAELYALLSSLAGLPICQGLAVTGSVNQRGEVQAVGGVTQKVEGFFQTCRARGLTGEQGAIIPRANVRDLMLREEVVAALRAGRFHVYAVGTIDEGIELLTGVPAGEEGADGAFPEGTVNDRVSRALRAFAERVRVPGAGPLSVGR